MADVDLSEYNGDELVVTAVFFLVLTYTSVGLRVFVRLALTRNFFADDWLMLVAQLIFTLSCSFILIGITEGLGKHNEAVAEPNQIQAIMWQALATATYIVNMMFIKLSIAWFLLRLAVGKVYKWILWISMAVITVWSTVLFFWDIFQCNPVAAQWDFTIPNAHCVTSDEIVSAAYALSAMTIVSDWLFALLPIPMVWNVKMNAQAKATVIIILGLGVFASVATLIRIKYLADLLDTSDILFAGTDAMVWTLIEPGVAITAASLVTIRPLLRALRINGFQTTGKSKSAKTGGRSGGYVVQSATQRSNGGMPGFRHEARDITMTDFKIASSASRTEPATGTMKPLPE